MRLDAPFGIPPHASPFTSDSGQQLSLSEQQHLRGRVQLAELRRGSVAVLPHLLLHVGAQLLVCKSIVRGGRTLHRSSSSSSSSTSRSSLTVAASVLTVRAAGGRKRGEGSESASRLSACTTRAAKSGTCCSSSSSAGRMRSSGSRERTASSSSSSKLSHGERKEKEGERCDRVQREWN